jgi:hypothetical protein
MSENSTRPHSEKGVGPARRPSTRRIGASGLRNKPKWRSMRLKLAAIWRMSVSPSLPGNAMIHSSHRDRKTKAIAEVLAMIPKVHPELVPHRPCPVRETDEWLCDLPAI